MAQVTTLAISMTDATVPVHASRPVEAASAYREQRSDWGFFMRLLLWGMRNNR